MPVVTDSTLSLSEKSYFHASVQKLSSMRRQNLWSVLTQKYQNMLCYVSPNALAFENALASYFLKKP